MFLPTQVSSSAKADDPGIGEPALFRTTESTGSPLSRGTTFLLYRREASAVGSLHQLAGVFPNARIDQVRVAHRFLVPLYGADFLHQGGGLLELVLRHAVVFLRPEVDGEELLERGLGDFLRVA